MKKTFVLAALLATSFVARAETFKLHLPVAYATSGTMLPAGDYSVSSVSGSSSVYLFEGADLKVFVFARRAQGTGSQPTSLEIAQDKAIGMRALAQAFALSPSKKN